MGRLGPQSAAVLVTTSVNASRVALPMARR
jgi:hypothetical protein